MATAQPAWAASISTVVTEAERRVPTGVFGWLPKLLDALQLAYPLQGSELQKVTAFLDSIEQHKIAPQGPDTDEVYLLVCARDKK